MEKNISSRAKSAYRGKKVKPKANPIELQAKKFKRTIENFTCGHCGKKIKGNGYTNHCPSCLWSKHVDNYPGDRLNICGGLMEPIGLELQKGVYHIQHQCQTCGIKARCKASEQDDINALTTLSETLAKKALF